MIFIAAWLFVATERIAELLYARRLARGLQDRGGRLIQDDGMGLITTVHVAWFAFAALEWWLAPWAHIAWTSLIGAALFLVGDALRFWAIKHLGPRWNTRVYVIDEPLVASGPYRLVRHPNYVGVTLVLVGFPLAFHLYTTALVIAVANLVALRRRIQKEEQAWAAA